MIKIEFSEHARKYILDRTGEVTVNLVMLGGWGGAVYEPVVSTGKPDLPGNFDDVMVDGIKVYIYKGAVAGPDGIKISLEGDWALFHNLKAEGLIFEQPVAGWLWYVNDNQHYVGFFLILFTIYKIDGHAYDKFIINSSNTIRKDPFFYKDNWESIDYKYIKDLIDNKR